MKEDKEVFLKVDRLEPVYKESMSWNVTQDYIKGKLSYLVENTETDERVGEFDWQARAQEAE